MFLHRAPTGCKPPPRWGKSSAEAGIDDRWTRAVRWARRADVEAKAGEEQAGKDYERKMSSVSEYIKKHLFW